MTNQKNPIPNNASVDIIPSGYTIFVKPTDLEISQRKYEGYKKYAEILQWGRRNPIAFAERFFGIQLLDNQKFVFMKSWITPYSLWTESRAAGKTTMAAIFIETKSTLFPNYNSVICSGTAAQSIETFRKLEDIAKKNISSFTGLTDFFMGNVVANSNTDGWIHNPMGFTVSLFNNSKVRTINSSVDTQRGKRANLVFFDECGFLSEEVLQVIGAYTSNDSNFKLGGDINLDALPKEIPNQLLLASSASSTDTPFYRRYRDFAKKMILGDDRYFVADINCNVVIDATYKGEKYPASLLTRETVDNELRQNPIKANREYYNKFTTDGGANQIIKRQLIARNSVTMPPLLYNDTNEKEFVFAYDPARTIDNSMMGVGELFYDKHKGWMMRVVNMVSFADLGVRKKTPMRSPEQVATIKELLVAYNGKNPDYDNVEFYMDGGAGGGGTIIPDYFMEDWYEKGHDGDPKYLHRGLIDKEYSAEYVGKYPNACKNLHVMPPKTYKSLMYESLIENVQNDLIVFPEEYSHHGFLNILELDDKMIKKAREEFKSKNMSEEQIATALSELNSVKTKVYKLTLEEEVALSQIDLMKEEVVNICRFKTETGKDRFALPPHKDASLGIEQSDRTMHDDRSYCLAMLSYALTLKRTQDRLNRTGKKKKFNVDDIPFSRGKSAKFL